MTNTVHNELKDNFLFKRDGFPLIETFEQLSKYLEDVRSRATIILNERTESDPHHQAWLELACEGIAGSSSTSSLAQLADKYNKVVMTIPFEGRQGVVGTGACLEACLMHDSDSDVGLIAANHDELDIESFIGKEDKIKLAECQDVVLGRIAEWKAGEEKVFLQTVAVLNQDAIPMGWSISEVSGTSDGDSYRIEKVDDAGIFESDDAVHKMVGRMAYYGKPLGICTINTLASYGVSDGFRALGCAVDCFTGTSTEHYDNFELDDTVERMIALSSIPGAEKIFAKLGEHILKHGCHESMYAYASNSACPSEVQVHMYQAAKEITMPEGFEDKFLELSGVKSESNQSVGMEP